MSLQPACTPWLGSHAIPTSLAHRHPAFPSPVPGSHTPTSPQVPNCSWQILLQLSCSHWPLEHDSKMLSPAVEHRSFPWSAVSHGPLVGRPDDPAATHCPNSEQVCEAAQSASLLHSSPSVAEGDQHPVAKPSHIACASTAAPPVMLGNLHVRNAALTLLNMEDVMVGAHHTVPGPPKQTRAGPCRKSAGKIMAKASRSAVPCGDPPRGHVMPRSRYCKVTPVMNCPLKV